MVCPSAAAPSITAIGQTTIAQSFRHQQAPVYTLHVLIANKHLGSAQLCGCDCTGVLVSVCYLPQSSQAWRTCPSGQSAAIAIWQRLGAITALLRDDRHMAQCLPGCRKTVNCPCTVSHEQHCPNLHTPHCARCSLQDFTPACTLTNTCTTARTTTQQSIHQAPYKHEGREQPLGSPRTQRALVAIPKFVLCCHQGGPLFAHPHHSLHIHSLHGWTLQSISTCLHQQYTHAHAAAITPSSQQPTPTNTQNTTTNTDNAAL